MCNDWKYKDGALALRSTCQCQNMVWLKHVCPQDTELEKKPYSFFTSAPSAAARAAASAGTTKLSRCYGYSSFRENSPFSTEKRSTAIILLQYCTTTTALGTLLHFVHFFIWPKNKIDACIGCIFSAKPILMEVCAVSVFSQDWSNEKNMINTSLNRRKMVKMEQS